MDTKIWILSILLLLDFPTPKFWVDYDQEADVLYMSFDRPQNTTDSEMTEDGILLRRCCGISRTSHPRKFMMHSPIIMITNRTWMCC